MPPTDRQPEPRPLNKFALRDFLRESNEIEGIHREPTENELQAAVTFLELKELTLNGLCKYQSVIATSRPLRDKPGMNVRVGQYIAPAGGAAIITHVENLLLVAHIPDGEGCEWMTHCVFEQIHPFMDGNGRTGRLLWAWQMLRNGRDPFALPFLHRFYYQTLSSVQQKLTGVLPYEPA